MSLASSSFGTFPPPQPLSLTLLPVNVWFNITRLLSIHDLAALMLTNRHLNNVINRADLWNIKLRQTYPLYREYQQGRHPKDAYRYIRLPLNMKNEIRKDLAVDELQSCLASQQKFDRLPIDTILSILNSVNKFLITICEPQAWLLTQNEAFVRNFHGQRRLLYAMALYHPTPRIVAWVASMERYLSDTECEGLMFMRTERAQQEVMIARLTSPCSEDLLLAIAACKHDYVELNFVSYAPTLSPFALAMLCMINKTIAQQIIHSDYVHHLPSESLLAYIIYQYTEYQQKAMAQQAIAGLAGEQVALIAQTSSDFGLSVLSSEAAGQLDGSHLAQLCLCNHLYADIILATHTLATRFSNSDIMHVCKNNLSLGKRMLQDTRFTHHLTSQELRNLIEQHADYADLILDGELGKNLASNDLLILASQRKVFAKRILQTELRNNLHSMDLITLAKVAVDYADIILSIPDLQARTTESLHEIAIAHEAIFWQLNESTQISFSPYTWQRIIRAKPEYLIYELLGLSNRLTMDALEIVVSHHDCFIRNYLAKAAQNDATIMINEELLVKLATINLAHKEMIMSEPVLFTMLSPEMLCLLLDEQSPRLNL